MAATRLELDSTGWCDKAAQEHSSNFDARPEGMAIDLLVIHNISLPPGKFGGNYISDLFCNRLDYEADPYFDQLRDLRVSAHFLICRDGALKQYVSTNDRAWHAGTSNYNGREQCNDFSIGIELEGTDHEPFTSAQYEALAELTLVLCHNYPLKAVAGHSHIAPFRKTDPGPYFEWRRYLSLLNALATETQMGLQFPATESA